jgi:RNA polymerase sigma factor (sigma-70 family)
MKPTIMHQPAGHSESGTPGGERSALVASGLAEHGRWLRTVLIARGVERGALDEVLQETAREAWRNAGSLRDASRLAPWLYRIAVTQALLYRRRIGRGRKLVERYADSGAAPTEAVDDDPLAWLLAEEQQQLVRRAIATLGSRDAEILLLKYTENWSYRELARRLGASESAVEARLHRARARLRAALMRLAPSLAPERTGY